MNNYEAEQEQYQALLETPEAKIILGEQWKPLPAAPVAPCFDVELLPPALREMVRAVADNLSVPVDLPALLGLGVTSACACGRVTVRLKHDWSEPAQLFLLGVMASGEGKTPAFRHMTKTLYNYQAEENKRRITLVEQDKAEMEVLQACKLSAVKQHDKDAAREAAQKIAEFPMTHIMTRFTGGNTTPERLAEIMRDNGGATSILDDEGELFELLAGRYQDLPDLNPYLNGYSGGTPLTVERKSGSIIIEKPALSAVVLTQPYVMSQLMDEGRMRGKGLLARFLIACPEPVREYHEEPDLPAGVVREYEESLLRFLAIEPYQMTLSPDAKAVFFDWRSEVRRRQWEDLNPLQRDGYSAKLAGNTARIAACLHLWENAGNEISAATMRNAVEIGRYFAGHLLHLLGVESGLTTPAKEAIKWLVQRGQPLQKERDVKRALNERKLFKADGTAEAALVELENAGYIRREQEKGEGRPVLLVRMHPDLLPQREVVSL